MSTKKIIAIPSGKVRLDVNTDIFPIPSEIISRHKLTVGKKITISVKFKKGRRKLIRVKIVKRTNQNPLEQFPDSCFFGERVNPRFHTNTEELETSGF